MQLENMMEMYQPIQIQRTQERERVYTIVDLESLSASALYMAGDKEGSFKWNIEKSGLMIPIKGLDVSIHDTYTFNKDGNLSNGHSTVNLPGNGKVYMPLGTGKPSIKSGS